MAEYPSGAVLRHIVVRTRGMMNISILEINLGRHRHHCVALRLRLGNTSHTVDLELSWAGESGTGDKISRTANHTKHQ